MQLSHYSFKTFADDPDMQYTFVSKGRRGPINKVLTFSHMGGHIYNLGMADMDEDSGVLSHHLVTDNGDTQMILITVARAIVNFTTLHPEAQIFIKGNSPARNRLYRMYVGKFFEEIRQWYEIYGLHNTNWEVFEACGKYGAYLVIRIK